MWTYMSFLYLCTFCTVTCEQTKHWPVYFLQASRPPIRGLLMFAVRCSRVCTQCPVNTTDHLDVRVPQRSYRLRWIVRYHVFIRLFWTVQAWRSRSGFFFYFFIAYLRLFFRNLLLPVKRGLFLSDYILKGNPSEFLHRPFCLWCVMQALE